MAFTVKGVNYKDFQEYVAAVRKCEKSCPMFGGTFAVHYIDEELKQKFVAYVEVWTEKKSNVRKAVIEKAKTEQYIIPETIIRICKFD